MSDICPTQHSSMSDISPTQLSSMSDIGPTQHSGKSAIYHNTSKDSHFLQHKHRQSFTITQSQPFLITQAQTAIYHNTSKDSHFP
ncbi:hypothetical protein CHS0354_037478 [Potamilus streckersoni]|uniref:Uncharacterized protein n=1 Tax=Potamilus streckersoni TaxID=2493646 RepID=A0AAE0VHK1_9BIVA|nr:hypothetical protein CHS0354_037478 [Potamilus streckersoni]